MLSCYSHFEQLGAVNSNTGALSNNLGGEDKVLEDLLVDAGEGTAAGSLLLNAGVTGGLAQHPALGNEDDVTVRELLLEFPGQPMRYIPL